MKINWFSPLPPQRTDIAHYSMRLAHALMSHFDITFWTDLDFDAKAMPSGSCIKRFGSNGVIDRDLRAALGEGINLYNIGNDARFHSGIAEIAAQLPGIPILHDLRLHHLVYERSRNDPDPFARYISDAAHLYGLVGRIRAEEVVWSDGENIDWFVERMPFTRLFTERSVGIICHSKWASTESSRLSLPIIELVLPFDAPSSFTDIRSWTPPYRLLAFGYMNANRRLESIIGALADWPMANLFSLDIYGSLWDEERIQYQIRSNNLSDIVKVHGYVEEETLNAAIAKANLAFHLRYPNMGESSGGILRSWAFAAPTLVTADGWFARLSEKVAFKIPPQDEIGHIRNVLSRMLEHQAEFVGCGLAGQQHVKTLHSTQVYSANLSESLSRVAEWERSWTIRHCGERMDRGAQLFSGDLYTRRKRSIVESLWPVSSAECLNNRRKRSNPYRKDK